MVAMVITANQSVTAVGLPDPARQQLQQVVDVTLINERCDRHASRSFFFFFFVAKSRST